MSIRPVAQMRSSPLRWKRFSDYHFAAGKTTVPLAAVEVPRASLVFPLAFMHQDADWCLAALTGLLPGENLFVGEDGRWIASYVPAAFRAYPFCVGWNDAGEAALCIEESSGLLVENSQAEPFFDENGSLTPLVAQVWVMLQEALRSEAVLGLACSHLHASGLFEPWTIKVEGPQGDHHIVPGIYRVSESALAALDDVAFLKLRRTGALAVAYAQLFSMGNLAGLGRLAQARAQLLAEADARAQAKRSPMITLPEDSSIDWDWSKIGR